MARYAIVDWARFNGRDPKAIGSTFLRADNLVAKDKDFFHWTQGCTSDAIIFQKVYWTEMMRTDKNPKILDLSDPDMIKGSVLGGMDLKEISQYVDAITCSSPELTKQVAKYVDIPTYYVPDRINFDLFPDPKKHTERAKTAVWFGYAHNAKEVLQYYILEGLVRQGLDLLVISNTPFKPEDNYGVNIKNVSYESDTAYYEIQAGDIFINPGTVTNANFKYKSNNKTVIAWKLGLPLALGEEELQKYLNPRAREEESIKRIKEVDEKYNIIDSGKDYKRIINEILKNKCKDTSKVK